MTLRSKQRIPRSIFPIVFVLIGPKSHQEVYMKILFCGGGTAGHVTPALAMHEMIKRNFGEYDVAFVGRKNGQENQSIIKRGLKLYTLDVQGIRRSITFKNLVATVKILEAYFKSKKIITEFAPDIVIGTGGYVAYPVIRAAQKLQIKTMIHESNAFPGLVTRMLGKKCNKVLLNLKEAKKHLKFTDNLEVIGNPTLSEFETISRKDARKRLGINPSEFFIVSFGGSLGSDFLNQVIIEVMEKYSIPTRSIRHIHSSGRAYYEEIKTGFGKMCHGISGCKIVPYIENMPIMLKASDMAITRSGAMTISELARAETASVLIPSPNVSANHQYENAKYIFESKGALMLEEKDISVDLLIDTIKMLKKNENLRDELKHGIASFSPVKFEENFITQMRLIL